MPADSTRGSAAPIPPAPPPRPDEHLIGLIEKPRAKGHKELIHDDGTTQVYRWVPDEE